MTSLARPRSGTARRLTTDLIYTPSAFVALAGLWIAVTPLVVDDVAGYPAWNDVTTGLLLVLLGGLRVVRPRRTAPLGVVNVVLGGWLIAAPFVLGFAERPLVAWNNIVAGVLVILFAGVGTLAALLRRAPG
ncbi:SPW repeat protein [Paractinoplanes atraurantiacus]|uniref:SPW repeat-containing protein n=1 Tax=Paractinoplanes atraurantiacus TaxID=1036182 RepID=A0A285GR04_9ACTN|nr:SPW repeat protein [Actinoplanes atraurantiacus]SNY25664.1 SPW repeat-containing protein [Actinoplanes atraurantiacus]